jgi:hypothetical protein
MRIPDKITLSERDPTVELTEHSSLCSILESFALTVLQKHSTTNLMKVSTSLMVELKPNEILIDPVGCPSIISTESPHTWPAWKYGTAVSWLKDLKFFLLIYWSCQTKLKQTRCFSQSGHEDAVTCHTGCVRQAQALWAIWVDFFLNLLGYRQEKIHSDRSECGCRTHPQ